MVLGTSYSADKEKNMDALLVGLGAGFAAGFTVAWLFAGGIKKEIAILSGKIDGFLAAMKKI